MSSTPLSSSPCTRDEWRNLEAAGHQVTLVDRARPLQEALQAPAQTPPSATGELSATAAAVPATYSNLDAILDRMQQIATAYPAIAQLVDITATYSTRPLPAAGPRGVHLQPPGTYDIRFSAPGYVPSTSASPSRRRPPR